MQIETNEQGFVTSYALVGNVVGGLETDEPNDLNHFIEHFSAYKFADGKLTFDDEKADADKRNDQQNDLRALREKECFSVINRGQLWYENLTLSQLVELRKWYKAWLNVTETMAVPDKPTWL